MLRRCFSSTAGASRELLHVLRRRTKAPRILQAGDPITHLPKDVPETPPYPYGEATFYKQSNRGLYGGKVLHFGHKISDYGNKHVRIFRPNVQRVTLWSETLKQAIPIRVVTSVLKTITREGGIDNYLLKDTPSRIKVLGPAGWALRFKVLSRIGEHDRTQPQPIEQIDGKNIYAKTERDGHSFGVLVGRTHLIKRLFTAAGTEAGTLKSFMIAHKDASFDELLAKLESAGVSVDSFLLALA